MSFKTIDYISKLYPKTEIKVLRVIKKSLENNIFEQNEKKYINNYLSPCFISECLERV